MENYSLYNYTSYYLKMYLSIHGIHEYIYRHPSLSHLTLCRFWCGVHRRVHHVLLNHRIYDDFGALYLLLRLALRVLLVCFAGLDVRDILLLLRRRWLRVNHRRGGRGLLPGVRCPWNNTTNDALAYPTTVENKNRVAEGVETRVKRTYRGPTPVSKDSPNTLSFAEREPQVYVREFLA